MADEIQNLQMVWINSWSIEFQMIRGERCRIISRMLESLHNVS